MKKALLIGAVVSSMALSSVAFAAVDYENATAWTKGTDFNYDIATGVLTVANGKTSANATTDTTIVVVNGENPTTIDQTNIMYIDQAASADTYGNMGLLLPATIADGAKATVLFNDGTAAIYTATFDLKETTVTPPAFEGKTFVFGDVTNGEYTDDSVDPITLVDGADSLAILKINAGGGVATNGAFNLGTVVETENGTKFVFGDVTNGAYTDDSVDPITLVDGADSLAILKINAGGGVATNGAFNLGTVVEAK